MSGFEITKKFEQFKNKIGVQLTPDLKPLASGIGNTMKPTASGLLSSTEEKKIIEPLLSNKLVEHTNSPIGDIKQKALIGAGNIRQSILTGATKTVELNRPTYLHKIQRPTALTQTFAKATIKDWYNDSLKQSNTDDYDMFNNLYKAIQIGDARVTNYHLSMLERAYISKDHQIRNTQGSYSLAKSHVETMARFFQPTRSEALTGKLDNMFKGKSTEQRKLQEIFENIESADLIKLRISDFLELTKFFKIESDKIKNLEAEATFGKILDMYCQKLISDDGLLDFLRTLEQSKFIEIFSEQEKYIILNKNNKIRICSMFQQIQEHKNAIQQGLVHEIYVNTANLEHFQGIIPNICTQAVLRHASQFQNIFLFRIWSIWEERVYFKVYPSVQIWELQTVYESPQHKRGSFNKKDFNEEFEQQYAADEFFSELWEAGAYSKSTQVEDNILLCDSISPEEDYDLRLQSVSDLLSNITLGKYGRIARKTYEDRETTASMTEDALDNVADTVPDTVPEEPLVDDDPMT